MARDADPRDPSAPQLRGPPPGATATAPSAPPDHVQKPQLYEVFQSPKAEDRQGDKDGGQQSSSGEEEKEKNKNSPAPMPSLAEALNTIKSEDFLAVHKMPCARESFLTGIGAGAVIGAGRFIFGARIPKAANWAFGSFLLGSIIQWEYCQAQRFKERAAMARAVEVIDRKQAEKKQRTAEAMRLREEAAEKARQAKKSWYRFW